MAEKCYCKWCGTVYNSVASLTNGICPRNPAKGGRHELYEGSEKRQYVCKYCGTKYPTISSLTNVRCPKHPNKGRHEPAL
jgi:hypothetical protein